jgi:hypothetical protein
MSFQENDGLSQRQRCWFGAAAEDNSIFGYSDTAPKNRNDAGADSWRSNFTLPSTKPFAESPKPCSAHQCGLERYNDNALQKKSLLYWSIQDT